jgi:hypothetical protein
MLMETDWKVELSWHPVNSTCHWLPRQPDADPLGLILLQRWTCSNLHRMHCETRDENWQYGLHLMDRIHRWIHINLLPREWGDHCTDGTQIQLILPREVKCQHLYWWIQGAGVTLRLYGSHHNCLEVQGFTPPPRTKSKLPGKQSFTLCFKMSCCNLNHPPSASLIRLLLPSLQCPNVCKIGSNTHSHWSDYTIENACGVMLQVLTVWTH